MTSRCKSCGALITWMQEDGRWIPMNLNGTSHFETCPHARQWRKKNKNSGIDYNKIPIGDESQTRLNDVAET